jgi:ABC-2 type transport system permease protein
MTGATVARGRKRKRIVTQPADQQHGPAAKPATVRAPRPAGVPAGWRVIAAKEFADQVTSIRFLILTIVLSLVAAAAVYSTAGGLKNIASDVSGGRSLFLVLFTVPVEANSIPTFISFFTFLGPLLGIAFGFDGINGERSEGTLPRLLSQPIHRDDVINGKFVAGLATIITILLAVVGIVGAMGILQLGIVPSLEDFLRLGIWIILAAAYVGVWLALALLCSVLMRRAATSALSALAIWLAVTIFAGFLVGAIAGVLSPVGPDATQADQDANLQMRVNIARLVPNQLFNEATALVLDPTARTVTPDLVTPGQADAAIPGVLSIDQSLLVIWPQFVALIAATAVMFGGAYVVFMRQEVRA